MLTYTETGSGNTILFLHGLGLNRNFWSSSIALLPHSFRCIAVDLPGHGESRDVDCNYSVSGYAAHIRALIEQLQLKDLTIIGHSMGGQISLVLALQLPAVITKLVLVCPAGIETFTPEERDQMRAGANAIWKNPVNEEMIRRFYPTSSADSAYSLVSEHLDQQRSNFQNFSAMLLGSISGMLDEPVFDFLPNLSQPVLCMFGQLDSAVPNRIIHPTLTVQHLSQSAKEKIPDCRPVIFPMAGHYLPVDQPKEFADSISRFL